MLLRVQRIARARALGVKDVAIAQALGLSNSGFQRIIRTQVYIEYERSYFECAISKMDEAMSADVLLMRNTMRHAVPVALRTIIETTLQRRDLKAALAAAQDILNRDPDRNFLRAQDSANLPSVSGPGLPSVLIDAISKDADGVSQAIGSKIKAGINKVDA
jgi:hypothetical protein